MIFMIDIKDKASYNSFMIKSNATYAVNAIANHRFAGLMLPVVSASFLLLASALLLLRVSAH
jgi:hypothetical protein